MYIFKYNNVKIWIVKIIKVFKNIEKVQAIINQLIYN